MIHFFSTYNHLIHLGRSLIAGSLIRGFCPMLPVLLCFACTPALFFSCTDKGAICQEPCARTATGISILFPTGKSGIGNPGIDRCQVLVYNDDNRKKLDSRLFFNMAEIADGQVYATSGEGDRKIVLLCNLEDSFPSWQDMLSLPALQRVSVRLEDESLQRPVLSGCASVRAGETATVMVRPLSARIRLREICSDFRDTAYAFEEIGSVRVYLSNVNADSGLLPFQDSGSGAGGPGRRYINIGGFSAEDCAAFRDRRLIYAELDGSVGMDPVKTDLEFLCYANPNTEEAFGCPLTRLVVEGSIAGKTWYWPIDLCRLVDGGIKAGENYDLRLTIRRTGTDDPDTPVSLGDGEIKMEVEQWNEKESYPVLF